MDLADRDIALVVVAGRFDLPGPGQVVDALVVSEEQDPVPLADVYTGEPGLSSLKWEGQGNCLRPGTDIYVSGQAWAPRGRPVASMDVGVRVGPCRRAAAVFGERHWSRVGIAGPSAPLPFERMPLTYERCFGGCAKRRVSGLDSSPISKILVS